MAKNVKWLLASSAVATALASGIILLDQAIGPNPLNLASWGQANAHPPGLSVAQATTAPQQATAPAAPPSVPRRTETVNYDSWTVSCTEPLDKSVKKACSGVLEAIEEKQKRVVFAWIIARDTHGVLRSVMQTPTGVLIAKGVELKLGKAPARTVPYTACEPQRCQASIAMDDALVKDSIASPEATATIYLVDGRSVNFKMPIKGIDKVYASIGK
jgi:invasion protein IalB